jgi:hypothetical protein
VIASYSFGALGVISFYASMPHGVDALMPRHPSGRNGSRRSAGRLRINRRETTAQLSHLAHTSIGISGDPPLRSIALSHPHNALSSCSSGSQSWRRGCRSVGPFPSSLRALFHHPRPQRLTHPSIEQPSKRQCRQRRQLCNPARNRGPSQVHP